MISHTIVLVLLISGCVYVDEANITTTQQLPPELIKGVSSGMIPFDKDMFKIDYDKPDGDYTIYVEWSVICDSYGDVYAIVDDQSYNLSKVRGALNDYGQQYFNEVIEQESAAYCYVDEDVEVTDRSYSL